MTFPLRSSMDRWGARQVGACLGLAALLVGACPARADQPAGWDRLEIMREQYPRAFFFRSCEGLAASGMEYSQWERTFGRLMGIIGKVLDEEVPGRSIHNIDYFTRFKKNHPDQLVLMHYNGNARDPRYQTQGRYFAGHWTYFNGAKILEDVPAEEGVAEIRVDHPELFRTNMGRYLDKNEDVGLCELDAAGKPDWGRSEQVQLISIDRERGVLRVRRGCYGTAARAFRTGKAYAAAHATEGPWGNRSHLMWFYNYSTRCPRDPQGRNAAQVHAEELAARFAPGGELAAFDGLEFDVLSHARRGTGGAAGRGMDYDGDGRIDDGVFDGVNTYGIGVIRFLEDLRARMGEGKLILADGHGTNHQRGVGPLNGIESEGWPSLRDAAIHDWSGGLNRHLFWRDNGRPPAVSYINHKFNEPSGQPGVVRRADVPMRVNRLVFAAAAFTDSAVCYSYAPRPDPGEALGVWDELWMGREKRRGWLGRPEGPAVRLALGQPDLLDGAGRAALEGLSERIRGAGLRLTAADGWLKIEASDPSSEAMRFVLENVSCDGPDLFVSLSARAEAMQHYPAQMPRLMHVGISAAGALVVDDPETGMRIRGQDVAPIDRASGAAVQRLTNIKLGGRTLPGYRVHPPYRTGAGMTFWQREIQLPEKAVLEFFTGMGEKAPQRSDGVVFSVEIAELSHGAFGKYRRLFQRQQVESRWIAQRVDLSRWSGQRVRLRFVADAGPNDNTTTDHAYWGAVRVVLSGDRGPATRSDRFMTWVGRKPFSPGFYFDQVHSERVDLTFFVEGSEPVYLADLTARAAPDVIYRNFDHGLVVANPSPRPVTLDLNQIAPGRRFRRLRGSPQQDPVANNGARVGRRLTLQPKEGLFLVKMN